MSKPNLTLSIIVPAYNEELYIGKSLTKIHTYLKNKSILDSTEVIVVAAGSDKTASIAKDFGDRITNLQIISPSSRVGKGRDVRLGMMAARGKYMLFTDADLATPIEHIDETLKTLQSGATVVIGTRDIKKMHNSFKRRLSSQLGNTLIRLLVAPGIKDTQCGYKAFESKAGKEIFDQLTIVGWGFDFEVIAVARLFGNKISTQEINDWSDPKGADGLAGDSPLAAMAATMKELLIVRYNLLRKIYDKKS